MTSYFLCGFTFQGLQITRPHQHLQSVKGLESTMLDIVCISPQEHRSLVC